MSGKAGEEFYAKIWRFVIFENKFIQKEVIMGLIKALGGAAGGNLADQWKEFFYCDAIDNDVLVVKGQKRVSGRSSNTKGEDNIITNGSGIAVADGQCMIIVEDGKVAELCAEPGRFTYDGTGEPSIFSGNLGESIIETFKNIGKRFTYGGLAGRDQRVYYFNTKEILDNKFGTANPVPFRVVDKNIGLDVDVSIRCNGVYSYKITDPILFYTNVCGNVSTYYEKNQIEDQLKSEFINALQPALAKISDLEIRPNAIPSHTEDLSQAMNDTLTQKWSQLRGISIISIGLNSVTLPEEDANMIKEAQRVAIMKNPTMAAAALVGAQADAMKGAANNPNGAMMGFMGMGMANQMGGMNAQNLFAMGQQQGGPQGGPQGGQPNPSPQPGPQQPAAGGQPNSAAWTCKCGAVATGKFCPECGSPKPQEDGWTCSKCGKINKGKFCQECGSPKPAGAPMYKCDKCGYEPEDPFNPPKFCPECGDLFDDNDKK